MKKITNLDSEVAKKLGWKYHFPRTVIGNAQFSWVRPNGEGENIVPQYSTDLNRALELLKTGKIRSITFTGDSVVIMGGRAGNAELASGKTKDLANLISTAFLLDY